MADEYICKQCAVRHGHIEEHLMPIPPHMNPMTPDEVRELLGATMHGDLPRPTIQRMLATLAAWEPTVRAVKNEAVAAHDVVAILDAETRGTD